jgi:hypothetical protein
MGRREPEGSEPLRGQSLEGHISRAQLFKATAAGLALAALPAAVTAEGNTGSSAPGTQSFPFFPQVPGTYTTETVTEIVSNLLTMGYLGVTGIAAIVRVAGTLGIPATNVDALRASLASRQFEIDFFSALVPDASPLTTTFTIPPELTSDRQKLAAIAESAATLQVGIYLAAVREFAELGQPTLAKYAAQTLGVQAEARVLARVAAALNGVAAAIPPPNKAFETDLFLYTRDAIALVTARGFINGPGTAIAYPGREAALALAGTTAAGIIQRMPNNATMSVTPGSDLTAQRT